MEVALEQCEQRAGRRYTLVTVSGQASVEDGACFRRLLEVRTGQGPTDMIVDLSRLSTMDWWAALMLMWVARVMQRRGGALTLAAPRPAVATLLRSAGAFQLIPIYNSVRLAADARTARPAATRSANHRASGKTTQNSQDGCRA